MEIPKIATEYGNSGMASGFVVATKVDQEDALAL